MNHCPNCRAETMERVCATCRYELRDDLAEIIKLDPWLEAVALLNGYDGEHEGGPPLGGEPMVMLGPVALGRVYADDGLPTPLLILAVWEIDARTALGVKLSSDRPTAVSSARYLTDHIPDLLRLDDFPWSSLIRAIRTTRIRMEDVLHAGLRDEHGAPCPDCHAAMIRKVDPRHGLLDQWECALCYRTLQAPDYWGHVLRLYRTHAPALSAEELEQETGLPASRIRVWGSKGVVTKRGKDHVGRQLYDASEVRARVVEEDEH